MDGGTVSIPTRQISPKTNTRSRPRISTATERCPNRTRRHMRQLVTAYVTERRRDYLGLMTQMLTGYGHYTEMYGPKWGAKMISLEVGENIITTQSKYAFARGSSRRFKVPWSAQVSPWHPLAPPAVSASVSVSDSLSSSASELSIYTALKFYYDQSTRITSRNQG